VREFESRRAATPLFSFLHRGALSLWRAPPGRQVMQMWRAMLLREEAGVIVSTNMAPATRTASMLSSSTMSAPPPVPHPHPAARPALETPRTPLSAPGTQPDPCPSRI